MPGSINISGTYKEVAPYVKVAGTWKFVKEAWTKVSGTWKQWFLAGGLVDPTFSVGTGFNAGTYVSACQPDGKIVIVGDFTSYKGVSANGVARLNYDGSLDTAFSSNIGTGADIFPYRCAVQSDGKILIGGLFNNFNTVAAKNLIRLNSDGTRDTAFMDNLGSGFNGMVTAIYVLSSGKILVGGGFTTLNGITVGRLVLLNSDGTQDTTFTTNIGSGPDSNVWSIGLQSDGKIVISGPFTTFNGSSVGYIARLSTTGVLDTTFRTNNGSGANNSITGVGIQSTDEIVITGNFTSFNGTSIVRVAKLNANGGLNSTFTSNIGTGATANEVSACLIQPDDSIVLSGRFLVLNGTTSKGLARLSKDGVIDSAFYANIGNSFNNGSNGVSAQHDGKLIFTGQFTSLNGASMKGVARIGGSFSS